MRRLAVVATMGLMLAGGCADPVNEDVANAFAEQHNMTRFCNVINQGRISDDGASQLILSAVGRDWFVERGAEPDETARIIASKCK